MGLKQFENHLFDETTDGYIQIVQIPKEKTIKIYNTNNINIREIVEEIEVKENIYVTPNTTYIPRRGTKNIRQFRALFQDIDCEKLGLQKAEVVYMMWELYYKGKIPKPTMIVDSGRGIHAYWKIKNAPYGAIATWQELQDYLYHQLKHLGADRQATDAARILRVPGTKNTKNGEVCKVVHIIEKEYSMYDLREQYLNYKPKTSQVKWFIDTDKKSNKVISNKFFNSYSLHIKRAEDVETICRLRKYDMKGCRNAILHCYAYWKGVTIRDREELGEIVHSLNNAFIEPLKNSEVEAILRCIPKAIDKFIAYEQGLRSGEVKRVTKGMRDKGGYWYKNETLIDIFKITPEEEKTFKLQTIISLNEKYDRKNKKRRNERRNENGLTTKQQELADLKLEVLELREQGLSIRKIAEKLGKSKGSIENILKK